MSTISSDLRINGDVVSDGDIQLDGAVQGNVRSRNLIIGETGSVTGEVSADSVRVLGKVVGPIKSKAVVLAKTANVTGEVRHESLTIDAGAFIDGHCKRLDATDAKHEERLSLVHNKN
jgi:cytoskeletal protein CcmA (bactofilin family)